MPTRVLRAAAPPSRIWPTGNRLNASNRTLKLGNGAFTATGGLPMHQLAWPLAGLLLAYALLYSYRFFRSTVEDTILLTVLAGAAMLAGYLFG
jgi:hypothetical protein